MGAITVRFIGTCCFTTARPHDMFVKRVILPTDRHADHRRGGSHIPYVEIDAVDIDRRDVIASKTYTRGQRPSMRSYLRFDLDGERISILGAERANGGLVILPSFAERVPNMTLVCPDCPPHPRMECFDAHPPRDLVAAYFDIHDGYLSAGRVEEETTAFDEGSRWPSRRLARWVELEVSCESDPAELLIEKIDGSSSRRIPLAPDAAVVTIGNQPESDIEQRPRRACDPRGDFEMYYDLGVNLPAKRPRPTRPKGAIRGCSPVAW